MLILVSLVKIFDQYSASNRIASVESSQEACVINIGTRRVQVVKLPKDWLEPM